MRKPILRRLLPVVFSLAITSVCLFGSAGRFDWANAWLLLGLNLAASLASTALLWRNPELLAERSNVKAGKSWDKPIVGFTVLLGPVAPGLRRAWIPGFTGRTRCRLLRPREVWW